MYDGNNVVYEWEADIEGVTTPTDETETFHVFVGNLRVARIVDGDLQFLITDHLGSTRVITDDTGNLLHRLDYRPFGEELTSSGTDGAKFTGKTEDRIGLYYYGARFYDPTIGRFLTVDPARDGLNWYAYTYNNPLRYVDPTGMWNEDSRWWNPFSWFNKPSSDSYEAPAVAHGLSTGVDFIPVFGDAKGLVEAFVGYDLITYERLGWGSRLLGLLFLSELRSVGKGVNAVGRQLKGTSNLRMNLQLFADSSGYVNLTGHRSAHILNRHRAGTGLAGKSEFPARWSDPQILHHVSDIATDPNAITGIGKWKSPYGIGIRDGVTIRVDFYPLDHPGYAGKISTAYPIGVPLNP